MKRASTLFLKTVLVVIALAVLALAIFGFPNIWEGVPKEWPAIMFTQAVYPGLIGIFLTVIPFWFALFQAFKILQYIDQNNAFSNRSIQALKYIKYCAVCMTALYMTAMPLAYVVAELDDAPGLILISFAFACAPLVVATFAAVLQMLIQNALDLKTENDLTV
jgi:hypothetical protein